MSFGYGLASEPYAGDVFVQPSAGRCRVDRSAVKTGRPAVRKPPPSSARNRVPGWSAPLVDYFRSRPKLACIGGFAAIFFGLIVLRRGIIDSPPYYDFATGLFLEANFLAESNFDYAALVREQARWLEGGAAVYVTSIMPTLVAVMMKVLPSPRAVLIAYHLFNFASAAAAVLLLLALARPYAGFWGALLTGAMLITVPVFSTQIDMLGMDLPMTACALAAVLLVARGHYSLAALAGLATSLVKTPGRAVASAIAVYLLLLLLLAARRPWSTRRGLWLGLGTNLLVCAFQEYQARWLGELPQSRFENWSFSKQLFGGENMLRWTPTWFPDQLAIFALAALACLALSAAWVARQLKTSEPFRPALYRKMVEVGPLVVGWIISVAVIAALAIVYCLPRYFMLVLPFVYLAFGYVLFRQPRWRIAAGLFACALVAFNVANAYGRFYPAFPEAQRTGALLERSRECLVDHESNIRAVRRLAREHPRATIIAATPFVHFLSLPRLGYVDHPLSGYSLNRFTGPTFVSGMRLPEDRPRDVVFIYANNPFTNGIIGPPRAGDTVLYDDHQPSPLVVYRRRWPAEIGEATLKHEYEMLVLPEEGLTAMATRLAQEGDFDGAIGLFGRAIAINGYDPRAHYGLGYALIKRGKRRQGIEHLRIALRYDGKNDRAWGLLGAALAEERQFDEAIDNLRRAAALNPKDPTNLIALGKIYLVRDEPAAALRYFEQAARLRPGDPALQGQLDALRQTTPSRPTSSESK
jgi:tetratricopeptide (TPR) repeat protein